MKHTEGPWRIYDRAADEPEYQEFDICSATDIGADWVAQEIYVRADAHLIAAAPELLEACKKAAEMIDDDEHPYDMKEMLNKAINKAEGVE